MIFDVENSTYLNVILFNIRLNELLSIESIYLYVNSYCINEKSYEVEIIDRCLFYMNTSYRVAYLSTNLHKEDSLMK